MTASHARSQLRHRPTSKLARSLFLARAGKAVNEGDAALRCKLGDKLMGPLPSDHLGGLCLPMLSKDSVYNHPVNFLEQTFRPRCLYNQKETYVLMRGIEVQVWN